MPFLITGSKKTENVSFTLGTVESSNVPAAYSYTKTSYEMKMFGLYKGMSTSVVNDATQETIYSSQQEGCSVDPSWQLNDKVTVGGSIELVSPPK